MNPVTPAQVLLAVEMTYGHLQPNHSLSVANQVGRQVLAAMLCERCHLVDESIAMVMGDAQARAAKLLRARWQQQIPFIREWGTFVFDRNLRTVRSEEQPAHGVIVKRNRSAA